MSEKEIIESEVFIGARSLDENQVKLILPTYDNVQTQIEEIRKSAKLNEKNEYRQYNNTISIFGKRGTGKTSILFTIIEKLNEENHKNIILPKIEPDSYSNTTKILGAILRLLKSELDKINDEISSIGDCKELEGFFKHCKFNLNNSLTIAYNELLEYYCYMNEEYREILIKDYSNIRSYSEKYSYILAPDHEFNLKFNKFIRRLVKAKKDINKRKCKYEEPLVFIIIDDIDLKTTKCKELVDVVLSCICNKNIVCFLSGDEDILNEAITLSLLDNENMANKNTYFFVKEIFDMTLLDRKKELTKDYLKKALPPAFRHNVVNWNLTNIPKFSFAKKLEEDFLGEKLHENFCEGDISIFKNVLFKYDNKLSEYTFIPYYIFDKTPRGLINIFYYLNKYNGIKEKNFAIKKAFIDTIISSSNELSQDKNEIYDNYIVWSDSEDKTIISFLALYNNYLKLCNKDNQSKDKVRKKTKKKYLRTYILLVVASEVLTEAEVIKDEEGNDKIAFFDVYGENISNNTIEFSNNDNNNEIKEKEYTYEILKYADFKFSLMLFENSKSIIDEDDLFVIISKLISCFSPNNYLKEWISDRSKYRIINGFLNKKVIEIDGHKRIKKLLFDYEYNFINTFKEYGESIFKNHLKNIAFYNYIINNKLDKYEYEHVSNDILFARIDQFNILRTKDKFKNKIHIIKEKLTENIFDYFDERLKDINKVKLYDRNNQSIVSYVDSAKEKSEGTLYYGVGKKVELLLNSEHMEIEEYIGIYEEVSRLSNNSRAWYGVYESIELLNILNKNVVLDLDYDVESNKYNKYQVVALVNKIAQISSKEEKYLEVENCRNIVMSKMKETYYEIIREQEYFYKQANYELEEFEEEEFENEYF
ncbi:hypothetical protein M4I33_05160 [Clostridium sp. LY3-2]|uniref:hypothetical protein n=1 Tax=Clostridium sp. LY3-2 TaxID=2942482 RepID=UPI0021528E8B|nr:hypothetical protein [Clostridium sp. LY3-2]MCR6514270.1 hypothetical protein [Clostridium sp. LY3-2]